MNKGNRNTIFFKNGLGASASASAFRGVNIAIQNTPLLPVDIPSGKPGAFVNIFSLVPDLGPWSQYLLTE